jgi:DNA mismatch repair protein MutS2
VLRSAERSAETRARQEARQYLLDARAEVERAIREIRESAALDESAREARRRIEELAAGQAAEVERLAAESERAGTTPAIVPAPTGGVAISADDTVQLSTLGGRSGRVLEIRGDDAVVAVGAMKLTVPVLSLSRARGGAPVPTETVTIRGDLPEEEPRSEIDLRGLRVDEMETELLQALDGAVRGDLRTVRIIHGKGTGALRERVAELLRGDPRVREFRLGAWNEGGAGVTVAELR